MRLKWSKELTQINTENHRVTQNPIPNSDICMLYIPVALSATP
jgi:hypothetical protein